MTPLDITFVKQIAVVLGIGLMIGLQREIYYLQQKREEFAGTRTFTLIALMGYLSSWIGRQVPHFLPLSLLSFALLVAVAYTYKLYLQKHRGTTSEVTALLTFMLGVMVEKGHPDYAVFLTVIIVVFLEFKSRFRLFEEHVAPQDTQAAVLFLLITFVVLPLLPDRTIDPWHVFNPYQTWLMVVLVAGISFVGYIAIKILGTRRGVYLTGIFGGLISSTAVSITLSKLYALRGKLVKNYAGGIAVASTFMYLRVLFEATVFNFKLAKLLMIPYLAAAGMGMLFVWYLYATSRSHTVEEGAVKNNPLELSEALKLGLLFGLILGSIGFFQERYGDAGVYVVSALSGLTDVDAITLSLSKLAGTKITQMAAINGIVIATVVNSVVKLGIVFVLGGRKLGSVVGLFYLITLASMVGALFVTGAG
ncbi:MAG: hypothetical protein B6D59_03570 [Campylobacteraceae bacterium 4484_4]|nr:MAG: hypothetical protein B6D59_03570 [Campylobacteraceae bacterium 4484_4]